MKTRQLGFALVGIIGLVLAFEIGLHLQAPPPSRNPKDRLVTISASPAPDTRKCEVDFPVVFLRYSRDDSVQWASSDNKYWISFVSENGTPVESPLAPPHNPVVIEAHGASKVYHVKPKEGYNMYAIFDHDPATNNQNPCKNASDDHDTGLNIKP